MIDELNSYLAKYGDEDTIGGWDNNAGGWPIGSIWSIEGQYLYSLIRATRPARVLELGTFWGCSATHMAAALHKNGKGKLTCVDSGWDFRTVNWKGEVGQMIPDDYRDRIKIVDDDIPTYVNKVKSKFDIVFEDGAHDPESIKVIWSQASKLLKPGGWLIGHDAMHFIVGKEMRETIEALGFEPTYLLPKPSDCGFAFWRNDAKL